MMDIIPKKRIVWVNFSRTVFSLLFTHDYLAMQAMRWFRVAQFRGIWIGVVQFGASYLNLRWPVIFMHQM